MTNFKNPADIIVAVKGITDPLKPLMKDIPKQSDLVKEMELSADDQKDDALMESIQKLHMEEMKVFAARRSVAKQNKTKLYGVIWGQCSPALQSELMGEPDFKEKSSAFDCIWLLGRLKLISAGLDKNSNVYVSTFHAM